MNIYEVQIKVKSVGVTITVLQAGYNATDAKRKAGLMAKLMQGSKVVGRANRIMTIK